MTNSGPKVSWAFKALMTRALTRRLALAVQCVQVFFRDATPNRPEAELLEAVRASEPMAGRKLADTVSVTEAYDG